MSGSLWSHHYYVDKVLVAELRVHKYTSISIRPGPHEIHSGATPEYKGLLLPLNAVAGETYYFVEDRTVTDPASQSDTVRFLSKEAIEPQLVKYHYQKPIVEKVDGVELNQ